MSVRKYIGASAWATGEWAAMAWAIDGWWQARERRNHVGAPKNQDDRDTKFAGSSYYYVVLRRVLRSTPSIGFLALRDS